MSRVSESVEIVSLASDRQVAADESIDITPGSETAPRRTSSLLTRIHRRAIAICSSAVIHIWAVALIGLLAMPVFRRAERFAVETTVRFESNSVNTDADKPVVPFDLLSDVSDTSSRQDSGRSDDGIETILTTPEPQESEVGEVSVDDAGQSQDAGLSLREISDAEVGNIAAGRRSRAGGQIGEVTISLIWGTVDDLDLHVWNADRRHVWYGRKKSRSGHLDVDMNVFSQTEEPIENYFEVKAGKGNYRVAVDLFRWRTQKPIEYVIGVWIRGEVRYFRGIIDSRNEVVAGFHIDRTKSVTWASPEEARQLAIADEFQDVRMKIQHFGRSRSTTRRLLSEFIKKFPDAPQAQEARKELKKLR